MIQLMWKSLALSQKIKHKFSYDPAITSKRTESRDIKRYVHSSIIYNSQKMGTIQMLIVRWVDKQIYIYIHCVCVCLSLCNPVGCSPPSSSVCGLDRLPGFSSKNTGLVLISFSNIHTLLSHKKEWHFYICYKTNALWKYR